MQKSCTSKLIFTLSVIIALAIGFGAGSYLPKYQSSVKAKQEAAALAQKQAEMEEQLKQDRILDKEKFAIAIPAGWAEVPAMPSTSATVMFVKEEVTNETLKEINFKSYYAITYDTLNKRSLTGYSEYLKGTLQRLLIGMKFTWDKSEKINELEARVIEAEATQKGADFKVLIFVIKGQNEDVWTISFNTGKDSWDKYKDTFYSIGRSFQAKNTNEQK